MQEIVLNLRLYSKIIVLIQVLCLFGVVQGGERFQVENVGVFLGDVIVKQVQIDSLSFIFGVIRGKWGRFWDGLIQVRDFGVMRF